MRTHILIVLGLLGWVGFEAGGTPPLESDPFCRLPTPSGYVAQLRANANGPKTAPRGMALLGATRPPQIGLRWDEATGTPLVQLIGQPKTSYSVEAATHPLGPWTSLLGLELSEESYSWPDTLAGNFPSRFYRVRPLTSTEEWVDNFRLVDLNGKARELWYQTHLKGVVLVAAGEALSALESMKTTLNEAATAWAGQGVELWVVLSDNTTPRAEIASRAMAMGLQVPVVTDREWLVTRSLGLDYAGQAVLVRAPEFSVVYRGPVLAGEEAVLAGAVEALVKGQSPKVATLSMSGAPVPRPNHVLASYHKEIGPILRQYCAKCHRAGGSAPFALTDHAVAAQWAPAMRNAILTGEMPPWHPDPEYPAFAGSLAMPTEAKQKLVQWLSEGAPRGEGPDPLLEPLAEEDYFRWPSELGEPDAIVEAPEQSVAATGIEAYRYVHLVSPNTSDVWLKAAIILPSNREVTHHYIVYMNHVNSTQGLGFTSYVPGMAPRAYPEGTGVELRANRPITFELHYTPNGRATTDRPKLALWYHTTKPAKRFVTVPAANLTFKIPPRAADHEVRVEYPVPIPATLYSVGAHMHLRGKSMSIELAYPNGKKEIVLALPKYNFHWQMRYELVEPKVLPIGTRVRVWGTFDNSSQNLANPDPDATVVWGEQSHEEMFIGVLDVAF